MRTLLLSLGALGCLAAVALGQGSSKAAPVPKPTFATVKPILKACVGCHQGPKAAHRLDLTTYASVMKGDKVGKVVNAGQPLKSRLAMVLHGKPELMPPTGALKPSQIALVEAWIKAGAKE